jgi:hypothetical protein
MSSAVATKLLFGVIPLLMVIVGRRWVRPSERYQQLQEIKQAQKQGDEQRVKELLEQHDVDVVEIEEVTVKQLFADPGWTRRQLARTTLVWLFTAGLIIGSGVWTALIGSEGARTLLIVGGGFAVLQLASSFLLPNIKPGQELEDIAT